MPSACTDSRPAAASRSSSHSARAGSGLPCSSRASLRVSPGTYAVANHGGRAVRSLASSGAVASAGSRERLSSSCPNRRRKSSSSPTTEDRSCLTATYRPSWIPKYTRPMPPAPSRPASGIGPIRRGSPASSGSAPLPLSSTTSAPLDSESFSRNLLQEPERKPISPKQQRSSVHAELLLDAALRVCAAEGERGITVGAVTRADGGRSRQPPPPLRQHRRPLRRTDARLLSRLLVESPPPTACANAPAWPRPCESRHFPWRAATTAARTTPGTSRH